MREYNHFRFGIYSKFEKEEKLGKALIEVALGFLAIIMILFASFGFIYGVVASFNMYHGFHLFF